VVPDGICVIRALAIATERNFRQVHDALVVIHPPRPRIPRAALIGLDTLLLLAAVGVGAFFAGRSSFERRP